MIATIHAHQGDSVLQSFLFEDHPPDFLVELAHQSIDNGADAFVGHGPHILRGIEIYKGKPIFYDLGEFFREWDWSCDCNFSPNGDVTQAENVVRGLEARGVVEPINYESAIAAQQVRQGAAAGDPGLSDLGATRRSAVAPRPADDGAAARSRSASCSGCRSCRNRSGRRSPSKATSASSGRRRSARRRSREDADADLHSVLVACYL